MSRSEEIRFYSVNTAYGEFSNFAYYPIKINKKIWKTTEHYFQAQKFKGTAHEVKIRKAPSPMKAAQLGRTRKIRIRQDWDRVKDHVMYTAVKAKFSQHEALKQLLIKTGEAIIIEDAPNDDYWGIGSHGKGLNKLGKILMQIRKEFLDSKE